jgi:hypothetical protein
MRVDAAGKALSEWAYPVPGMWRFRKCPDSHGAAMGLRTVRGAGRASDPIRVCIVAQDGVRQHPPFGGDAPATMGDGQQPPAASGPGHSQGGALHIHVMAARRPASYHQVTIERRLKLRTSHNTVGRPLASHGQRLSNVIRGIAPCKLPLGPIATAR